MTSPAIGIGIRHQVWVIRAGVDMMFNRPRPYGFIDFWLDVTMHNECWEDFNWRTGEMNQNRLPVKTRVEYAQ